MTSFSSIDGVGAGGQAQNYHGSNGTAHSVRENPETTADSGGVKKLILVVEDDIQSQQYMRILLSKSYAIETASVAQKALEILEQRNVRLVLMDISLQGEIDGLQLTRIIRRTPQLRDMPVIALTAHAFPADRQRSLDAGCTEYLSKPFQREQLIQLIDRFIR